MNETHLIRDVLADESHEGHSAVKEMMEKLASGEISLCGCLGPMYGEPYCPCQMKQRGLQAEMEDNPVRQAEEKASSERWKNLWMVAGFLSMRGKLMVSNKQQELLDEENPLQIYGGGLPCWGNKTLEDIQKMLDEPSIQVPSGLAREEMREFILRSAE